MIPNKDIPALMNAAYYGFNRALPGGDFAPKVENGALVTHCNQFIQYVAKCLGYTNFDGMTANEMVSYMRDPANGWIQPADHAVAQDHANKGVLVIAGRANPLGHGHVCLVVPGILEKSGNWCAAVPKCVNVGKDVFFGKLISFAFNAEEKCDYFALAKMI